MTSDFTNLRSQLSQKRSESEALAQGLTARREQLKQIEHELKALTRVYQPNLREQRLRLEQQAATLRNEIERDRNLYATVKGEVLKQLTNFTSQTDPSQQTQTLNDTYPILFFPLRLETRFKTLPRDNQPINQLWVRVYPDDCQVDSFEALLSEPEVKSARSFWSEIWKAGGIEAQERGAWKTLVDSYGSGRAAWIVQQYIPLDSFSKPTKTDAQDIILVIIPQITLTPTEETAAYTFWTQMWRNQGNPTAQAQALQTLQNAVGAARVNQIQAQFKPENLNQNPIAPYTRQNVTVTLAQLEFDPTKSDVTKATAWTQAPKAVALPDRLVVLCFKGGNEVKRVVGNVIPDGLVVGPDPSLPDTEQIQLADGELVVNPDLRWMVDFDQAFQVGMGFKIDLTDSEAQTGFDRLLVLGIRFSASASEGQQLLETLISHHAHSKHGFGLVPQGSPTNNTESESAAYTWIDDADTSYDQVFKGKEAFVETEDRYERRDGEWLAHYLGINPTILKTVPHSNGRDQGEARAMNTALWSATLGYFMEEMMVPVFNARDIYTTRQFFTTYVSGRGSIPSVRVGRQPYGILPAMAFSRYKPLQSSDSEIGFTRQIALANNYFANLHRILRQMDKEWEAKVKDVAHVGKKTDDAHQLLLDIIGLHSGSVEYHQRYAESLQQLYNTLVFQFGTLLGGILANWLRQRGRVLLQQLGFSNLNAKLPILEKFFLEKSILLTGPVVDDRPLSETEPIRDYSPDKKNYLTWLATSSLETIRRQDFGGNPVPTALLYLLLRHGMMLSHWDAGIRMLENRQLVNSAIARPEANFLNVQTESETTSLSKFHYLYQPNAQITGDTTTLLAEHILKPAILATAIETRDLREIIKALDFLQTVPTARLERLFSEHLDCCSYRLDAWKTGLITTRLEEQRQQILDTPKTDDKPDSNGIYLGAYGWLENVKPETKSLSPVRLPPELSEIFQKTGQSPLYTDSSNAGYIHAPSLNHAATAAVLKNAYRVNASSENRDAMSVNLSSERVRQALGLLEGMRNGQSLSALLGYRLERGLHDRHNLAEVDKFIYPLRQAFPLVADQIRATQSDGKVDIRLLEARNVVDGVRFIKHIRQRGIKTYPFGLPLGNNPGNLPIASSDEQTAINLEVDGLLNLHDAISDLVLAESVYQVVQGNFERAAANTEAFSKGKYPPEPEVVQTPRRGLALNHRMGLHLDAATNPNASPNAIAMTPRAKAEAPLNQWLSTHLPNPVQVVCQVAYTTPATVGEQRVTVSQQDLGLQAVDLLYLAHLESEQAMKELDDRIVQFVRYQPSFDPHPGINFRILYTETVPGNVTFFELTALLKSLRTLLLKSRYLAPTDMALPVEAESQRVSYDFAELHNRIAIAINTLTALRDALTPLESDGSDLDDYARVVSQTFLAIALYGIPQTGTGDIHDSIRLINQAILEQIQALTIRWDEKATDFTTLMASLPTLTTDEERFTLLLAAEGLISAETTPILPATPNAFRVMVDAKKATFDARLVQFKALLTLDVPKLVDVIAAVNAIANFAADHDAIPFSIDDQKTAITTLRADLVARVTALKEGITTRITQANTLLTDAATVDDSEAQVRLMLQAAQPVLGEETRLLPRFQLATQQGTELQNCWTDRTALLTDLQTIHHRRFPVDDWLYGLARVREKLSHWENALMLIEAFQRNAPELTPLQLPYRTKDRWLALELPDNDALDQERLLYTAHFAVTFNSTIPQCGLLLDEWTEVIPTPDQMTGVSFHFDRPDCEPPQVMLLAVPPVLTGHWQWDDLVAMLHETLDAAKKRAVEPAQIDQSNYAQFLPATLMAVTLYQITIATNLAFNNKIYQFLQK